MSEKNPVPVTLTISDPAVLERAKVMAAKEGRRDWRQWLQEQGERATKGILGLAVDLHSKEAALFLGIHVNSIYNWHKAGRFPGAYYHSIRDLRIPMADLLAIKAQGKAA